MAMNKSHTGFITADGIHNLTPREAAELCMIGAVILDIRQDYINQYKKFGVPNTAQIPLTRLKDEFGLLSKDAWIIVADSSGLHSKEACLFLEQKGFMQVSNLAGGFVEWERDGMPVSVDKSERLTGSCACQLRARDVKKPESK
jgi:rhodanese-related sulfurtransferase